MMSPIYFLVLSSFFHATWNSLLKTKQEKNLFLFQALVIAIFFGWVLSLNLDSWEGAATWPWANMILSGMTEGIYFVTLAKALRDAPLAMAYSLTRTTAMTVSWIVTYSFMHESINSAEIPGILLVLVGLLLPLLLKLKSRKLASTHSFFWSYLCGLSVVAYNAFYSLSLNQGAPPLATLAISLSIGAPFLLFAYPQGWKAALLALKAKKFQWYESRDLFLLGALITASFYCYLSGLIGIGPSMAITIRNLSIGFALIYSKLLGEHLLWPEKLSLFFIVCGVLLLSLI
jgi:drug/metabolite transporter (DMT)-like permease